LRGGVVDVFGRRIEIFKAPGIPPSGSIGVGFVGGVDELVARHFGFPGDAVCVIHELAHA
jgi:hypothetical protein